jgi:hypothetical protein
MGVGWTKELEDAFVKAFPMGSVKTGDFVKPPPPNSDNYFEQTKKSQPVDVNDPDLAKQIEAAHRIIIRTNKTGRMEWSPTVPSSLGSL